MAALSEMTPRTFADVERDLRAVTLKLGNTPHPKTKIKLLRQLRELIQEADLILGRSERP